MSDSLPISVVIPTRERADVLVHCLRTVVAQDYAGLSILVSDNASEDNTREVVESFADPRIRYINPGRRLSMSDHWEFALGHIDAGWLTILGDDDGLLPGTLERLARIVSDTGVSAVRSSVCAYRWPSLTGAGFGRIELPLRRGLEVRDSRAWLARVLDARASYLDLPMLYNGGFVDFAVLERLRQRTGRFYRSAIPDVYMAVAIASLTNQYVYSDAPLAINGASRHSTGTSQFSGGNRSAASPAARFLSEQPMPFHPDLPLLADGHYPSSFQLLVYESWLQTESLREPGIARPQSRQLELILATAGRYRSEMLDWGRQFAAMHDLDLEAARRAADRTRLQRRPRNMLRKLMRKFRYREAGSDELPLDNVFDASRYAAEALKISSSTGI